MPRTAPYGFWDSPITPELAAERSVRLGQVALSEEAVYWTESRPADGGRHAVVRAGRDGQRRDAFPAPFDARSRVHEYGGAAFVVDGDAQLFSNLADQRIYHCRPGAAPRPVTPAGPWRYADFTPDPGRGRLIGVREDHGGGQPRNSLAAIDLKTGEARDLAAGRDFYAAPRLSPDGRRLAWLAWDHPCMPWDGAELWTAEVDARGELASPRRIAGGQGESALQPKWSPGGVLCFVSDRNGWWNLHRLSGDTVAPILEMDAEFGSPPWFLGQSTYDFESAERLICAYTQHGVWRLARLPLNGGELEPIDTPYDWFAQLRVAGRRLAFKAGSPTEPSLIAALDLDTGAIQPLQRSFHADAQIRPYFSRPEPISFPTERGLEANGLLYSPRNPDFRAPAGELPPLIVDCHGGPTWAAYGGLSLETQYWTSRGFAVFEVNYGGSAGFGRAYRDRLNGRWGLVDVEDCVNGARFLAERGKVDGARMAVRGGSAGGFTALTALASGDLFRCGGSHYGVSDLERLARQTHKFESHYLDRLIGPYPARRDLYRARSPVHFADRVKVPVVFFQGRDDPVTPAEQSERMADALRRRGVPVAYVCFEGESHGFLRADTIKRVLRTELDFYQTHLAGSSGRADL